MALQPTGPLEALIAERGDLSNPLESVREEFSKTDVHVLGHSAGEDATPEHGSEADLLHFTIEQGGVDKVMLPVFTRPELMQEARLRNEDWQVLSSLQMNGYALLQSLDPDVSIAINPWTHLEFVIPASSAST